MRYHHQSGEDAMAAVQIKGRVPESTAALFDLAVEIMAQTTQVLRRHRGGVTRTVAFTQNAAVIAALTEWAEAVITANPALARHVAEERLNGDELDETKRQSLVDGLAEMGITITGAGT